MYLNLAGLCGSFYVTQRGVWSAEGKKSDGQFLMSFKSIDFNQWLSPFIQALLPHSEELHMSFVFALGSSVGRVLCIHEKIVFILL